MADADPARYFAWDYDRGELIEWERSGECCRCGLCCMTVIRYNYATQEHGRNCSDATFDPHDGGDTTDGKGVWIEWNRGKERRFFNFPPIDVNEFSRCGCLSAVHGTCMIHAQKKLIQSGWPFCPDNVTPFLPYCTYEFTEIRRWKFDPAAPPETAVTAIDAAI